MAKLIPVSELPPHDGREVWLVNGAGEGKAYVVPSLALSQVKTLRAELARLQGIGGVMTDEDIDALVRVAQAALSRNYPSLTIEAVADMVDLNSASVLLAAVVGVSGLELRSRQEGSP